MCGSSVPVSPPTRPGARLLGTPAPNSAVPQPALTARSLNSAVTSEFQAMSGAITSTRGSRAAVTNWMPPP